MTSGFIKTIMSLLIFIITYNQGLSNNVQITNISYNSNDNTLSFHVSWDNAFRINTDWSDHVYIFAKYKNANGTSWESVFFEQNGHSDDSADMIFSADFNSTLVDGKRLAMRAYHMTSFTSGTQSANCTAQLADNIDFLNPSFKVFGIEMIQISNTGNDYYIGDGISQYRWHKGDDTTQAYFWEHSSTGTASVGTGPDDINTTHPDGIAVSTISSHIFRPPNNIMKYEISQIQYVEFLNCLNRTAQNNRTATDISGTSITNVFVMTNTPNSPPFTRNGIRCDSTLPNGGPVTFYCDYNDNGIPNEYGDGQNIAVNYISGQDLYAYLDWAGLEPLNEIEYEQICRGSFIPVPGEFAWGTSEYYIATIPSGSTNGSPDEYVSGGPMNGPLRMSQNPMRCGAAATSETNRQQSGASAYGIMELSGNVAELVISLKTATSFNTNISVGDGVIDMFGNYDENWPTAIVSKGFAQNLPGETFTVSQRKELDLSFLARSAFYGGRGGY